MPTLEERLGYRKRSICSRKSLPDVKKSLRGKGFKIRTTKYGNRVQLWTKQRSTFGIRGRKR